MRPLCSSLGFVSTIFFGWLPLYLPELFPTYARATGAGVSFNFGRILTAFGVLATGAITAWFQEDYGRAGSITTLVYALGNDRDSVCARYDEEKTAGLTALSPYV